jgi:hypothetical protein
MRTRAEWYALLERMEAARAVETNVKHRRWLSGQVRVITRRMKRLGLLDGRAT